MKKLLNHQAVSEALCQMAAKQPQAAAAMLGQSLGPGALSKLPVGELAASLVFQLPVLRKSKLSCVFTLTFA